MSAILSPTPKHCTAFCNSGDRYRDFFKAVLSGEVFKDMREAGWCRGKR